MKSRLTGKPDSRRADGRHLGHELGIEPQVRCQLRFLPELLRLLVDRLPIGALRRCVQVAVDPVEAAVDGVLSHGSVDLRDGGEAGVPRCLGVRSTDALDQVRQSHVRDHGQVRGGVAGFGLGAPPALEQRHGFAGRRQEIRRGQAGDAAAYHRGIDADVVVELGKRGRAAGLEPI